VHRTGIASLAVVALMAVGASTATTASAKRLVLSEDGIALAPGGAVEPYGVDNLDVTLSTGRVECEDRFHETGLRASVSTNSLPRDELQIDRVLGGDQEPCHSEGRGNAAIVLEEIAGPLKLRATGKASTGPASVLVEYEHVKYQEVAYGDFECFYGRKALQGGNTATVARQKLELELGGKLALDVTRSSVNARHICSKTADMTLSLDSYEDGVIEEQTQG
jgi:hypothetical protein